MTNNLEINRALHKTFRVYDLRPERKALSFKNITILSKSQRKRAKKINKQSVFCLGLRQRMVSSEKVLL